jgi:hypothetical protein
MSSSASSPVQARSLRSALPVRVLVASYSICLILSTWVAAFVGASPAGAGAGERERDQGAKQRGSVGRSSRVIGMLWMLVVCALHALPVPSSPSECARATVSSSAHSAAATPLHAWRRSAPHAPNLRACLLSLSLSQCVFWLVTLPFLSRGARTYYLGLIFRICSAPVTAWNPFWRLTVHGKLPEKRPKKLIVVSASSARDRHADPRDERMMVRVCLVTSSLADEQPCE